MCMFSGPVESVSETRIFARSLPEGRQVLVYRMKLSAKKDVAMILPIPVKPGSGDKAVQFVDLARYPDMMSDMEELFNETLSPAAEAADPFGGPTIRLAVENVGAFEASYVPSLADFTRLDERFRLPSVVWDKLPFYSDFGFVVFKFRKVNAEARQLRDANAANPFRNADAENPSPKADAGIHPMAFAFPRKDPARLFFPTVHVHDGEVHDNEDFDHVLYCQKIPGDPFSVMDWQESPELPAYAVNIVAARGIVDPRLHVYRKALKGRLPNTDTVLT